MQKNPSKKTHEKILPYVGAVAALLFLIIFIRNPSWPTPDKLLVFLTFIFMMFGQAKELLKRFVPFVGLLLIYESFRGLADKLNNHVHYLWMPQADRWLFGRLPTATLQSWWWHGRTQWYDFAFYAVYMLHFILPITLAIVVWKLREKEYWRLVGTYVTLSFAGFLTYLVYPAAPPWLASDMGLIEPIRHVSSDVFASLGFHDFPSIYNKISPNIVAAVPSLHAAYSTLFVIFITKYFGKKWGALSLVYPFTIFVGTVYTGEHYAVDAILGVIYAVVAYFLTGYIFKRWLPVIKRRWPWFKTT